MAEIKINGDIVNIFGVKTFQNNKVAKNCLITLLDDGTLVEIARGVSDKEGNYNIAVNKSAMSTGKYVLRFYGDCTYELQPIGDWEQFDIIIDIDRFKDADTLLHYTDIINKETPTGDIDGTNNEFYMAYTPYANSENIFLDGVLVDPLSETAGYKIEGNKITFATPPVIGTAMYVSYLKNNT